MKDIKFYQNPHRQQEHIHKPYVPAYQEHGINPIEIAAANIASKKQLPNNTLTVSSNPRTRPVAPIRQNVPFAEVTTTQPLTGPLPNVGNNMETNWTSVEGDDFFIDDSEIKSGLDPEHPMVDNNYDDETNYKDIPTKLNMAPAPVDMSDAEDQTDESVENQEVSFNVGQDEYVVVVHENIVAMGTLDKVEMPVRQLVFGEHPLNKKYDISTDDIIVLKRIKIKVGVFIE